MIIIPLFSENTCNTTIMWHNFNMSSPGRPYLRMSDFDTVFRQITAVGEPHRNALGWEGHLVEADELFLTIRPGNYSLIVLKTRSAIYGVCMPPIRQISPLAPRNESSNLLNLESKIGEDDS